MHIDIIDEIGTVTMTSQQLVLDVLHYASDFIRLPKNSECSVVFVTNNRIQDINREYRGKDTPTDVISFALDDDKEDDAMLSQLSNSDYSHHIGDIIISIDKAKEQALEYQHSFERELAFLALHGFLHLNGYDHMNADDEKEMFTLQEQILTTFGLARDNE